MCLIFGCSISFEDISHSHQNTKSACWRSEQSKGVLGEFFFHRMRALKSKRQLLKMNSKPHPSFEAVDWAKKNS